MTHRFPIKEIARQAGVGPATVDRVLNARPNVSPQTRLRVEAALRELEAQEAQLAARGRRMFFDFVVEAPTRFSGAVKAAAEHVLPEIGTAVCRLRFEMAEVMGEEEVVKTLARIAKRGSQGVCLKAKDTPKIRAAADTLVAAKIPVVTLVTDLQETQRAAYVGLDNESAGKTAAFLVGAMLKAERGVVLAMRSDERFLGEEQREAAFVAALSAQHPQLEVVTLNGGRGVDAETARLLAPALATLPKVHAVYSMGGGNRAILRCLRESGHQPIVFIAHDLDRENRQLLEQREIDFVLHHDLRADMRSVFGTFLGVHGLTKEPLRVDVSAVAVLTPENIPPSV